MSRSDEMKAVNNTLTPPGEDVKGASGRDYPGIPAGREQVAGGSGQHAAPGYAAPPGRTIDRNVDPAAPAGAAPGVASAGPGTTAATDLDEGANPDVMAATPPPGATTTGADAASDEGRSGPGSADA